MIEPPLGMSWLLVALVGGLLGSFYNVVVYRLPLGQSIVKPASHCGNCQKTIRFYDNIPVISWLLLRGRCRDCRTPISFRYPLVELTAMCLAIAMWALLSRQSNDWLLRLSCWFVYLNLLLILLANALIDFDWFILPEQLTLYILPFAGLAAVSFGDAFIAIVDWRMSLYGALVGGGLLLAVDLVYRLVCKRVGLGGGDWKLLALIGALIGPKLILLVVFFASLQGLLFYLLFKSELASHSLPVDPLEWAKAQKRGEEIAVTDVSLGQAMVPFGPFLVLAGLEVFFFAHELTQLLFEVR